MTDSVLGNLVIQTGNAAKVFNMTVLTDEITNSLNSNNNIYCKYYSIQPVIISNDLRFKHRQTNKVSVKYYSRDMSKHKTTR